MRPYRWDVVESTSARVGELNALRARVLVLRDPAPREPTRRR
jgi:hypothetical protein